jgi:hypothetical protein
MEKINRTDRVKNEVVLYRVKEETSILHTVKRKGRKANWIGHILHKKNCLLQQVKETRGCWKLKEEALDCTWWRTRLGRSYGALVRQAMK